MCPKIIFSLLSLWNKAMPTYCSFAIASQSQNRLFHARDLLVAGALVSSPVPEPSSLPKEIEKMVEKIVEGKIQQKDKKQKDEKEKQKDEEESEECFACSQSQHTGATLDFDNMMV